VFRYLRCVRAAAAVVRSYRQYWHVCATVKMINILRRAHSEPSTAARTGVRSRRRYCTGKMREAVIICFPQMQPVRYGILQTEEMNARVCWRQKQQATAGRHPGEAASAICVPFCAAGGLRVSARASAYTPCRMRKDASASHPVEARCLQQIRTMHEAVRGVSRCRVAARQPPSA